MSYTYRSNADCDRQCLISGAEVAYYSKRLFRKKYPKNRGGFRVIGTVGEGVQKKKGKWEADGRQIPYFESKYNHFIYGVDGYLECDEDVFLEVVHVKLGKHLMSAGLVIVLMFGIGMYASTLLNEKGPMIDKGAGMYELKDKELPVNSDPDQIAIPGYGDIRIAAGSETAKLVLYNPKNNPCYFKFILKNDETGEILFESDLVPPGQAIQEIKFNKAIKEGIYPLTIRIRSFDTQDYTKELNGGEIKTHIIAIK